MRLVSRLSLANHLAWSIFGDLGSFLMMHASLSLDEFHCEGFWEVDHRLHLLAPPGIIPVSFQQLHLVLFFFFFFNWRIITLQ